MKVASQPRPNPKAPAAVDGTGIFAESGLKHLNVILMQHF
jgi:hypothetical protein